MFTKIGIFIKYFIGAENLYKMNTIIIFQFYKKTKTNYAC